MAICTSKIKVVTDNETVVELADLKKKKGRKIRTKNH